MPVPDIKSYLDGLSVPDSVKADAWDAYHAGDNAGFVKSMDGVQLPKNVKADLYDMRFGGASAPSAASTAPGWDGPLPGVNTAPPVKPTAVPGVMDSVSSYYNAHPEFHPANIIRGMLGDYSRPDLQAQQDAEFKAQHPNAVTATDLAQEEQKPLVHVSDRPGFQKLLDPNSQSILSRVATGTVKTAEGFTSPESLYYLAGLPMGGEVGKLAGTQFGVQMGAQAIPQAIDAGVDLAKGNRGQAAEEGTQAVLGAAMGAGALGHTEGAPATEAPVETPQAQVLPPDNTPPSGAGQVDPTVASLDQFRAQLERNHIANNTRASGDVPLANEGGVLVRQRLALPGNTVDHPALPAPMDPNTELAPQAPPSGAGQIEAPRYPGSPEDVTTARAGTDLTSSTDTALANGGGVLQGERLALPGRVATPEEIAEAARPNSPPPVTETSSGGDLAPSESAPDIEAPKPSDSQLSDLESGMRPQIGQVMNLSRLVEGDEDAKVLQKAIRTANPGSPETLEPEERQQLGAVLGQDVGSSLTPDQVSAAREALGHEQGESYPLNVNRKDLQGVTTERISSDRQSMLDEMLQTEDPKRKAQLAKALEPNDDGTPRNVILHTPFQERSAVDLSSDHPEAPFTSKGFDHLAPEITGENLSAALGKSVRTKDMGMLTKDEMASLKTARKAVNALKEAGVAASPEANGTVNENTNGMSYEAQRKTGDKDYTQMRDELYRKAAIRKRQQIVSDLRQKAQAYNGLRNGTDTELAQQLRKLPKSALRLLPKEVRDIAATEDNIPKTADSAKSEQPAKASHQTKATSRVASSTGRAAARSAQTVLGSIQKDYPEQMKNARYLLDAAKEHFGQHNPDGLLGNLGKVLTVFHNGLKVDDEFAMRKALNALRRISPEDVTATYNSGLNPEIGKSILRTVAPKLTDEDNMAAATAAGDAIFKRYEQMTSTERSAYSDRLHSEELDRLVQDADPKSDLGERLDALRKDLPKPKDTLTAFTQLFADNPEKFTRDAFRSMVRKTRGAGYMRDVQMRESLKAFADETSKWSIGQTLDFMHKMERGQGQGDKFLDELSSTLRHQLDLRRDAIQKVRPDLLQQYYEDYFPHIWANVGSATQVFKERATAVRLSGPEGFLKSREHEFFEDGVRSGLDPVSYDPIKLAMMRMQQMDRFITKEHIKDQMVRQNMAQFIKHGEPVPSGMAPLEDKSFERFGAAPGRYYATQHLAADFNTKFASSGMTGKWDIGGMSVYDGLRTLNNSMNIAKLSLSALHATESAAKTSAGELASGLKTIINDRDVVGGGKKLANWATVLGPVIRDFRLGGVVERAIRNPQNYQEYADTVRAFETANGRIGIDPFYGTHFQDGLNRNWKIATDENKTAFQRTKAGLKVPLNAVGRGLEMASVPIMNKLVPRLKLAAFHQQVGYILDHSDGSHPDAMDREIQQAWDNVDNRFGEMVYDNMWMDRTTKDLLSLTMLSPGWNIGTARSLRDGFVDFGKSVRDSVKGQPSLVGDQIIRTKMPFKITDATAYIPAAVATVALTGAIFQHMHPNAPPMTGKDYFFPRDGSKDANGEDNRYRFKSDVGDAISMYEHPIDTMLHKQSPLLAAGASLYQNKDFFGRQVVDEGANPAMRAAQATAFMAKQYQPFSYGNYSEAAKRGDSGFESMLMNSAGFSPAPREYQRTDAENLASKYFTAQEPRGSTSSQEVDKRDQITQLKAGLQNKSLSKDDVIAMVHKGDLTPDIGRSVLRPRSSTTLQYEVQQLKDPDQAMNVFQTATLDEQRSLLKIMAKKSENLPEDQRQPYIQQLVNARDRIRQEAPIATHVYDHATGTVSEIGNQPNSTIQ